MAWRPLVQHALLAVSLAACSISQPDGELGIYVVAPSVTLPLIIRDFKRYDPYDPKTDPDFGSGYSHVDLDIVADTIGMDRKPVYKNPTGKTFTTHGKEAFDKWYRDVLGTNFRVSYPLVFAPTPDGGHRFDSEETGILVARDGGPSRKMFVPIDDGTPLQTPFGNQGDPHNYLFTAELHAIFTYRGGEFMECNGDDDLWVFIDGKLVVNLGGLHYPEGRSLAVDDLELTREKDYKLDLFYAERKGLGAVLTVGTTLDLRAE
jgi:fibro-slime domain-containing protein